MAELNRTPTGYWVIRDDDGTIFSLFAPHHCQGADKIATEYNSTFGEEFRVKTEFRSTISFAELPDTWTEDNDWTERVPHSIAVTDVPEWALITADESTVEPDE